MREREPKTWDELGIEVNRTGPAEQDTLCPKCSHTRKKRRARCLSVNLGSGEFYCHHCGAYGNQEYGWHDDNPGGGTGYGARLSQAEIKPKEYKPPKPLDPTPPPVDPELPAQDEAEAAWERAVGWFKARGISEEVLRRNKVTVARHWMRDADDGEGGELWVIAYPYFEDGVHINTKYRGFGEPPNDKLFQMSGGARMLWYGGDDLKSRREMDPKKRTAVIVEGENDKLALEMCGITNVISVPGGAPSPDAKNYDSKFDFMEGMSERFDYITRWIIAVDNDAPGRKLREELGRRIGPDKCDIVDWAEVDPSGHIKDANDALLDFGPTELLAKFLAARRPFPIDGIFTVKSLAKALEDRYIYGPPPALSTGWENVDRIYRVRTKLCTIVTGVPNIGKSTWVTALCLNLMAIHDFRIAMCSPEWLPIDDQIQAMTKLLVGKPYDHWHPDRMTNSERLWAQQWLHERIQFIHPESPTIPAILERADHIIRDIGARGLVIDPWSEIETSYMKPQGISQTDWIGQNVRMIKRFAKERDIHVWLVVHPTKVDKDSQGEYPMIDLYDLAGSANFANMADQVVSLWRSNYDDTNKVEVHVRKSRFRHVGKRGEYVDLYFDETTGRFKVPDFEHESSIPAPWDLMDGRVAD